MTPDANRVKMEKHVIDNLEGAVSLCILIAVAKD
jgi:hypothetical protein